jgi:hypothetical protein
MKTVFKWMSLTVVSVALMFTHLIPVGDPPIILVSSSVPFFCFFSNHVLLIIQIKQIVVVGHEIIGTVTKVGKNVTNLKVGDRAGVGPISSSCHKCSNCLEGTDNICEAGFVGTYNGKWENDDKTYGGYADKWRGDYRWAFKVPDSMSSEDAACFYCAGITTYAPLARANVNSKSTVGVLGVGKVYFLLRNQNLMLCSIFKSIFLFS